MVLIIIMDIKISEKDLAQVNRKEFKGLIPIVETSSHENINVDQAFFLGRMVVMVMIILVIMICTMIMVSESLEPGYDFLLGGTLPLYMNHCFKLQVIKDHYYDVLNMDMEYIGYCYEYITRMLYIPMVFIFFLCS